MNALVTGGGGFLGRHIVKQLLARGDGVTVFARGSYPGLVDAGATLINGDLMDRGALRAACAGMDCVFHTAAYTKMAGPWRRFHGPNVLGTLNVIDACLARGVPRLVYTSSPSVVFANSDHKGVDESVPYPARHESYYDRSKAMAEKAVLEADGERLCTCALRPHLIFGPGDPHLLTGIVAAARAGRLPRIGDGRNMVDWVYVEDAARAHLLAADRLTPGSPVAGSAYFISQDEPVLLYPWLDELLARLDIPPVRKKCP